ncbi:MAG: nitroreductase family protein [Actinobacteria bacterium]|nr:nitroreductase family protein [Actinomycetota bacterium]
MEITTAIRTTGSVRQFTDERVDDATVYAMLDDARFAPSGGNRQGWRVVVVKSAAKRRAIGDLMKPVWDEYVAIGSTGVTPFTAAPPANYALTTVTPGHTPNDLLDNIVDVPVVLVVAADLGCIAMMDKDLERPAITGGGSIYPFCWNVLLSARSRGLGGVMTTFLSRAEPLAAAVLGLPPTYALASTIFLGHPVHQPTKLKRAAVETFSTIDSFDGSPFAG